MGQWPLVGRAEEMTLLRETLAEPGAAMVLAGDAGVGKTRLQRELVTALAEQGHEIRHAVATASASAMPFGALVPLLDEATTVGDGAALARQLMKSIGSESDAVLSIDDAHLLDEHSAAVVHQIVAHTDARALMTIRTGESIPDPISALMKDGYARRFELQPLSRLESDSLVQEALGGTIAARALLRFWDVSAGNPLVLRELVAGGLDSGALRKEKDVWTWTDEPTVSPVLLDLVRARIALLSRSELAALELLAIGEPIEVGHLEELSSHDVIASLERKGLVAENTERGATVVRLVHPMYGEALRALAAPRDLDAARTSLIGHYARHPAPSVDALRLGVWHLESSAHDRPDLLREGAHQANRASDHVLAERLARAALEHGGDERSVLQLAWALNGQARYTECIAAGAPLLEAQVWGETHCELAIMLATAHWVGLDRPDAALELFDRGLERAATTSERQYLIGVRGTIAGNVYDSERVIETAVAAMEDRDLDARARAAHLMMATSLLTVSGRPLDALSIFDEQMPFILSTAPGVNLTDVFGAKMLAIFYAGGLRELIDFVTAAHNNAVADGDEDARIASSMAVAVGLLGSGQPKTAARYGAEFTDLATRRGRVGRVDWGAAVYAESLAIVGEAGAAETMIGHARKMQAKAPRFHHPEITRAEAWVLASRGELSAAQRTAADAARQARERSWSTLEMVAMYDAVRLGGNEHAHVLRELAQDVQGDLASAIALHAQGIAGSDAHVLDEASVKLEGCDRIVQAAEASAQAASFYERGQLRSRAAAAGERSRRLAALCEDAATPILGLGPRRDPLTKREREVVTLAARGMTNKSIAAKLSTSVRTVEGHLYQAFAKLGVSSREDLAAADGSASRPVLQNS